MLAGEQPPSDGPGLGQIEIELRSRLAGVREQVAELTRPPEQSAGVQFGKRVGDGTTDLHAIEERIERALDKITEGTYGLCDECGVPIEPGRLRAAPESALCLECARLKR
jgi:DnaK suppressor protein